MSQSIIALITNLLTISLVIAGSLAYHTKSQKALTDSTQSAFETAVKVYKDLYEGTNAALVRIQNERAVEQLENTNRDNRLDALEEELRIKDRKLTFKDVEVTALEEIVTISAQGLKPPVKQEFDQAMTELDAKRKEFNRNEAIQSERRKLFHNIPLRA